MNKRAIAFIDFEHWLIGYKNLYDMLPDIDSWYGRLRKIYNDLEIYFFADFTNAVYKNEIEVIKSVSGNIIPTRVKNKFLKKEITDFVMLDYIYQKGIERDAPQVFIIFSGDGHFESVVRFLKDKLNKEVIVYGVMGAFSNKLKENATKAVELPFSETERKRYTYMILKNMKYVSQHTEIIATFNTVVKSVATYNCVPEDKIKATLNWLLNKKCLYKSKRNIGNRSIQVILADWSKI